jgi:hypothetical protein
MAMEGLEIGAGRSELQKCSNLVQDDKEAVAASRIEADFPPSNLPRFALREIAPNNSERQKSRTDKTMHRDRNNRYRQKYRHHT